jgi:conjugal transfer/entry exclusion protein
MRRIMAGLLLMSLAGPAPGHAYSAVPVVEVGVNLAQNTITATQSLIHTAKWVLELTGLPTFILAEEAFLDDLATLQRIVQEGQQVGFDLTSLQAQLRLFALDTAPATSAGFAEQMGEIRSVVNQTYAYAMRTQTMIGTVLNTVRHISTLLRDVMSAVGGLQAGQTIAQYEAQLVTLQSQLQVQTSAFHHAESLDRLTSPFIEQSSDNISRTIWSDWAEGDRGL